MRLPRLIAVLLACTATAHAAEIAHADLPIRGLRLEVDRTPVVTGADIAASVQTIFAGKTNDDAPASPDLVAQGDLSGPGIDAPITLGTQPGHRFQLPPLHQSGDYVLQNIRLVEAKTAHFVQPAVPSFAAITVSDVFKSNIRVHQLTPDELRARGINLSPDRYDFYDVTVIVGIRGDQIVEIPYPLIIDKTTHEIIAAPGPTEQQLPKPKGVGSLPRFQPPNVFTVALTEDIDASSPQLPSGSPDRLPSMSRPTIPAAIVLPAGLGVLHQFFAVVLNVSNNAPDGASIVLDSITASLDAPPALRVAKVDPPVAFGQPVPIRDTKTGAVFLVAQAEGSADWSLEALRPGTHTISITIRATYKAPNQPDVAFKAVANAAIAVSDPRFQFNFVHPDNVRKDEPYMAYAFVTNTSSSAQTIVLDTHEVPDCSTNQLANNICRLEGDPLPQVTLAAGETRSIAYKLKTSLTGHAFAGVVAADAGLEGSITFTMGVSEHGIPLSPATLVLPHYAQFLNASIVDTYLRLLGLGYSLATAPLNAQTAQLPRVLKSDVVQRAQDVARAGQRIFVTRRILATDDPIENCDAIFNLALDLLDNVERVDRVANAADLREWDQLRLMEPVARSGAAAIARELERTGLAAGKSLTRFVDDFAAATAYRSPYALAIVHGTPAAGVSRPFALSVRGVTSGGQLDVPSESSSGWLRTLANGELTQLNASSEAGEIAMIGRWRESLEFSVAASAPSFVIDLVYPDAADGSFLRASLPIANADPKIPVKITISRGASPVVTDAQVAGPITATPIVTPALHVIAAAQDLYLDPDGHIVSLLLSRPVASMDKSNFALTTRIAAASYEQTRRNVIPGASLQDDGRMVDISFDHALSTNAAYTIGVDNPASSVVPRIDNNALGGIVYGKLLRGDGTAVADTLVQLVANGSTQYDTTLADGAFIFEQVPRNLARNILGNYHAEASAEGKFAQTDGVVRTAGDVQRIVLQFLGRGSATGAVRYGDGLPVANAVVTGGSTVYNEFHQTTADASGRYTLNDLPVGPLTFAATDTTGNLAYAATQIRTPGESIVQDLTIQKHAIGTGFGKVRATVKRSDTSIAVAGAHVGVYTQGYGLVDGFTDANGRFDFSNVPAGPVSVLASEFGLTRESAGVDLDLRADSTLDVVLTLHVALATDPAPVTVHGFVWRDDPAAPADRTRDVIAPNAIVTIRGLAPVTADANGEFTCAGVPASLSEKKIVTVFDPATARQGVFALPSLQDGATAEAKFLLQSTAARGTAKLHVRLVSATGATVSDYRVISPGFPKPEEFVPLGNGVYELIADVPRAIDVWAVPNGHHAGFGDQVARGSIRADFDNQLSVIEMRLPGQGTALAKILVRKPCPAGQTTCGEEYDIAQGAVALTSRVWSEDEQQLVTYTRTIDSDPQTGVATVAQIPAGGSAFIETVNHPAGYASAQVPIAYDGDLRTIELKLSSIGDASGRVLSFDGQTPVAGAAVRFAGSIANLGPVTTASDGSFRIAGVAANQSFRITAEAMQDGVFRTGYVEGVSPKGGGPVGGLAIVMRPQGSINGSIVDAAGAVVPLARYWARELAWPYRAFGTATDPLIASKDGTFLLSNVFAGPVRISATSPVHQEDRGDWQGQIGFENDNQSNVKIAIGASGTGSVSISVIDANNAFQRVPSAEVTLVRGNQAFDFGATDQNGLAFFDAVPADGSDYSVRVTSRSVGRSGTSLAFKVGRDGIVQVQVVLDVLGRVSGTVVDGDATPPPLVPGAPVFLTGAVNAIASTDGAGAFQFNGVAEGAFTLEALDVDNGRRATSTGDLFISKLFPERNGILLTLERTATLNVKVFLPDDAGNAGALAPLTDVKVTQLNYSREQQGNDLTFPKMLSRAGYHVEAREIGGDDRVATIDGSFASGTYDGSATLVFKTSGTVQVRVSAPDPTLISGAHVTISSLSKSFTVFTDPAGTATVYGASLGPIGVQVTSANLSASASATLQSHSVPLVIDVALSSRATIEGDVDAEAGGPSAGTSVHLEAQSPVLPGGVVRLDTRTDADGHYAFAGIPASATHVSLLMMGPDVVTVGASLSQTIPDGTTGAVTMPRVKLDATAPRVLSIDPPNNENCVSPNANVTIAFTEAISTPSLTTANFQLIATDDNSAAPIAITPELVSGVYRVRLTPVGLLKSNVVYRVFIGGSVTDLAGHPLPAPVGSSFTTVNYTEPRIVRVDPPVDLPLSNGATFRMKFNKAVDATSGAYLLQQLDAMHGQRIAGVPVSVYADSVDASAIVVAPTGVAMQPASFYRVIVSGVRDTQTPPNTQKEPQAFDFFSFDRTKPIVAIVSPVPAGFPLVSGVAYTANVKITDDGTTPSKDIQYVDWFEDDRFVARLKTAPFAYNFVAPSSATKYSLRVSATDFSNNTSDLASFTWDVAANKPPSDVVVSLATSSAYAGAHVDANVSFNDEGLTATVGLRVTGSHKDGTAYELDALRIKPAINQQASRNAVDAAWPVTKFGVDLPADLKEGDPVHFIATVTDSINQSTSATSDFTLLADSVAPQILSITPTPETHFKYRETYSIAVKVKDSESGVAHVAITYDGKAVDLTTGTFDPALGASTYTTNVAVTAKNADTRIHIVAVAYDFHGNSAQGTTDVIYDSVNDGTFPVAQWLSPLDGAALPAGQTVRVKLRVHAIDNVHVESVKFESAAFAAPIAPLTAAAPGDVFETTATINVPASGSFTIIATVSDNDPAHDVVLPITVDAVAIDQPILADAAITQWNLSQYADKSLLVSGAATHLYINAPLSVTNLIVINGATIGNPDRVKLDLTISGTMYVDADSSLDLTAKGLLGGWARSEDGVTQNNTARGMAVTGDGALGASASYAGSAGPGTNRAYGSLAAPDDFGSGGAGAPVCCEAGANGGGVIALHASRVVIAGSMHADGGSGIGQSYAGSGGSISITSQELIVSPATRITANGGDDDAIANGDAGGGGGRIAIHATDRLDVPSTSQIQACGGRNGTSNEGAAYVDGGAGTILLARPGETLGELIVSSADERNAASTHQTRGSPIAGTLTFDSVTIGPRALARFDNDFTAATLAVDPSAVLLRPTDQPSLTVTSGATPPIQDSTFAATYSASSRAGIGSVAFTFASTASVTFAEFPQSVSATSASIAVPFDAQPGPATLRAVATDRSGRTAEATISNLTIVANAPPTIDRMDVNPTQTYAGHVINVAAAASDDIAVRSLTLTSSIGTVATTAPGSFTVTIPPDIVGGTNAQLTLSASDAFPQRAPTIRTASVAILADTHAPSVTITSPLAGATFDVSSSQRIPIRATALDAEVGVQNVWASIGGGPAVAMTRDTIVPNGWMVDAPVPSVDGTQPVTKSIVVYATDYVPNTGSSAPVSVNVRPVFDPNAPVVSWLCPSAGAMFPSGYSVKLRVSATASPASPDNGVSTVNFFVGDNTTPIVPPPPIGGAYETTIPMPAVANGTPVTLRVVATSIRGNATSIQETITVVAGTTISSNTSIITGDTRYDNQTLIVTGGTLTIDGSHTFANLVVLDGATVTHTAVNAAGAGALSATVSGTTYVSCGGAIEASGKGYQDAVGGYGRTWPNTTTGGSYQSSAGSHGGQGGSGGEAVAACFGSAFDPNEPGGAGGHGGDYVGNAGGGIVRLAANIVVVDGAVAADGRYAGQGASGAGAGGSIRIDAAALSGSGVIHADGPSPINFNNGGGGGRVAIYAANAMPRAQITARGGAGSPSNGAAGTVFIKTPSQMFGDLYVDNGTRATSSSTTLTSVAPGPSSPTVTEFGSDSVKDINATLASPNLLDGIRLILNNDSSQQWPIVGNDAKLVRVLPDASFHPQNGNTFRGIYRVNSLTTVNAHLEVADLFAAESPVQKDAASTLVTGNLSPPAITRSLISLRSNGTGSVVIGQAGAVADPDKPITVILTNIRTGQTFTAMADNIDGHFVAGVSGDVGDVITAKARDGHHFPLDSPTVTLDPLTVKTIAITDVPATGWNAGSGFVTRTLALNGRTLVVGGYPNSDGSGSSNVVLLDTNDPQHPAFKRTVNAARGAIRDIATAANWAFIAADRLSTLNLADSAAQPNFAATDPCGVETAVAVSGTYAFTAESGCANDGRIHLYDVTNPATPRYLNSQDLLPGTSTVFTDLLVSGSDDLIALSASASGFDLTLIDRRDVNNLRTIGSVSIASFDAFRGALMGHSVYLSSQTTAEVVVVDIANPAAPVIAGRATLPMPGGNVIAFNGSAYVADASAGLVLLSSAPGALAATGSLALSGTAFDVAAGAGAVYVAHDNGVAVVPVATPPIIDSNRVSLIASPPPTVTISGSADAITGVAPVTVDIANTVGGSASSAVPVGADGSFSTQLTVKAGETIAAIAHDKGGVPSDALPIGSAPFGSSVVLLPISAAQTDANFRARALAIEGSLLAVTGWADDQGQSDKVAVFDVTNPASPSFTRSVSAGAQVIYDVKVANGWAYVASYQFCTFNLLDAAATRHCFSPGGTLSVAPAGQYAFTAGNDQTIRIYDATSPGSANYLRQQSIGVTLYGLLTYGSDYLVGISPLKTNGVGHDVMIFDRRDINHLVALADIDIPNFDGFRGRVVGTTLFVAGLGKSVAVVDLANPAAPLVKSVVDTGGVTHGIAGADTTIIAADSSRGVSFVDGATAKVAGVQPVGGNAWDVLLHAGVLYVANENGIVVVSDVVAPPIVQTPLVSVTTDSSTSARVVGQPRAIDGKAPLTALIANATTGLSVSVPVAADGSFSGSIGGSFGDAINVKVTDAVGRSTGPLVVGTLQAPPLGIAVSRISIVRSGVNATVTGTAGTITGGQPPLTVVVLNGANSIGAPVSADGSFSAAIAAATGDTISLKATDVAGHTAGPFTIGAVPAQLTVTASRVAIDNNAGAVSVIGLTDAVTGTSPIALQVTNLRTAATTAATLQSGNAFTMAISGAAAGDALTLAASDGSGAHLDAIAIGVVPPAVAINASHVRVGVGGSISATAGAIAGHPPLTVVLTVAGVTTNVTVASDGSFSARVSGPVGAIITAIATDASGHSTQSVSIGSLQYTATIAITSAMTGGDLAFHARNLAYGGTWMAVWSARARESTPGAPGQPAIDISKHLLLFDVTDATNPAFLRTIDAGDYVWDAFIRNGWIYVATNSGITFMDLARPTMQPYSIAVANGVNTVGVIGNTLYAFTSTGSIDGWDISVPSAPVQVVGNYTGTQFTASAIYRDRWFVGLSPLSSAFTQIYVYDTKGTVSPQVRIPNVGVMRGRIAGSTLYVTTSNAGELAIDLGPIAKPAFTPPSSTTQPTHYGLDVLGSEVAVAANAAGLTELDFSNTTTPVSLMTTALTNPAWDVRAIDGNLIVANDSALYVMSSYARPPVVDASKITVFAREQTGSVSVSIIGAAGAIRGLSAMTATVKYGAQTAFPATVQSDGSFLTQFTAQSDDVLSVVARDASGRASAVTPLGKVPAGRLTPVTAAMSDGSFKARQLVVDGHTLAVASRIADDGSGASNKIVLFDISGGDVPAYNTTFAIGEGSIRGLTARNGRLYVVTDRDFATVDIRPQVPVVYVSPDPPNMTAAAVTVNGSYAYVIGSQIEIYDVANPATPRRFTSSFTNCIATHALAFDPATIVAAQACAVSAFTTTNPYQLTTSFSDGTSSDHVVKVGQRVFATSPMLYELLEEPISDPSATPTAIATTGAARGLDAAGTSVFVADGSGVSIFDASVTGAPSLIRTIAVGDVAWDVKATHNALYVANESGITTVTGVAIPPAIDSRAISVSGDGVANAAVSGGAAAVTGQPTVAIDIATSSGGAQNSVPVAADGTFAPVALPGAPGAAVTITAKDGANRQSTASASSVPFATSVDSYFLDPAYSRDANATMRRLAVDGTKLYAIAGYPWTWWGIDTDEIFAFDTTRPLAMQTPAVFHAGEIVHNFAARNGWLYLAGDNDFATIDTSTGAVHHVAGAPNGAIAVTLVGNYAFVAAWNADFYAVLQTYDITNPAAPVFVRDEAPFDSSADIWGLRSIDAKTIVAFEPYSDTGGQVVIVDVSDVTHMSVLSRTPMAYLADATISGTKMYAYGDGDGITIVDFSNLASPAIVGHVDTPGAATGVAITGQNEIAVADGFGITFVDVSKPATPSIKGTQQIPGAPIDVVAIGKTVYVAAERVLDAMQRP